MVDGARTVAGDDTAVVVVAALLVWEVAGFCVIAFDVFRSVAGPCSATFEVSGAVTGRSGASVVAASGALVVVVAGWIGSGSFGNGARVSDGRALETIGVSTLGEFVVVGPGAVSVFGFVFW